MIFLQRRRTITNHYIPHFSSLAARLIKSSILLHPSVAFSPITAGSFKPSIPTGSPYTSSAGVHPLKMTTVLESPSAERNKGPIYDMVLSPILLPRLLDDAKENKKDSLKVLELAAGCGVHTTHFASSILSSHPTVNLEWIPSDPDLEARLSIDARVAREGLTGVVCEANGWVLGNRGGTACNDGIRDRGDAGSSKCVEDGTFSDYREILDTIDLVLCVNMIHIAPWEATTGLMECAGGVLRRGGMLLCYGPYKVGGTAVESNL